MPPRETLKLRPGQQRVIDALEPYLARRGTLGFQATFGYGKSLIHAASFAKFFAAGIVDRLLYIVPSIPLLEQFLSGARDDFSAVGLSGIEPMLVDSKHMDLALKEHKHDRRQVFVTTIQALNALATRSAVNKLMEDHAWQLSLDELHHYGMEQAWGRVFLELQERARLCLAGSATYHRKARDGVFGEPKVRVTYREAAKEKAVKALRLHAYDYLLEGIIEDSGEEISLTTKEIQVRAGGSDPDSIDRFLKPLCKQARWSPDFIGSLLSEPIEHLIELRSRHGWPFQMLVGAMSCKHAKAVCEQIQAKYGGLLRVDWVGTSVIEDCGRKPEVNTEALRRFCPPKRNGIRRTEDIKLDVLVHVGMAGEGLDSTFVIYVVHLNPANINNQNDQENGRAARWMPGIPDELQVGYIAVDSASPYSKWCGEKIMDVFDRDSDDAEPPVDDDDDVIGCGPGRSTFDLPREPSVILTQVTLTGVDRGDPSLLQEANYILRAAHEQTKGRLCGDELLAYAAGIFRSKDDSRREQLLDLASALRERDQFPTSPIQVPMAEIDKRKGDLHLARKELLAIVLERYPLDARKEPSARIAHAINGHLFDKFGCGIKEADAEGLLRRFSYVWDLIQDAKKGTIPSWLE